MPLGLYPYWVKQDPTFARELLAKIRLRCLRGSLLNEEEREYLAEAIGKIFRGVDPKRALYLAATVGNKRETFATRNVEIYNKVLKLTKSGKSKREAYRIAAVGTVKSSKKKLSDPQALTDKAVEAICRALDKALDVPKENRVRK